MEHIQLACSTCNYNTDLLIGTQERGQTLSDMNEDFAFYKLFQCDADETLHSIDVNNREFDGDCPEHKVKLKALEKIPHDCPKCNGPLNMSHEDMVARPQTSQNNN